jgi:hypothetical protein
MVLLLPPAADPMLPGQELERVVPRRRRRRRRNLAS